MKLNGQLLAFIKQPFHPMSESDEFSSNIYVAFLHFNVILSSMLREFKFIFLSTFSKEFCIYFSLHACLALLIFLYSVTTRILVEE